MGAYYGGDGGMPGIEAAEYTFENEILWKKDQGSHIISGGLINSATVDAGNTPTTELRTGLLLGRITAAPKSYKEWNPTGVDGSQFIAGVLGAGKNMSPFGTALNRFTGPILLGGCLKAASIIVPGQASAGLAGQALEHLIRQQLFGRFVLDDILHSGSSFPRAPLAKTADYTVTEADNGTLFTTRGALAAVNFTLPVTAEKGLRYGFFAVADFTMKVTSGTADTLVVFNDAAADSIAFQTAGEIVGNYIEVYGDGTGWLTKVCLASESCTPTIVT